MLRIRSFHGVALLIAAILAITACQIRAAGPDDKLSAKEREQKMIGVLKSDAPPAEKALACKRLAICGSKESVPELAGLLANEQLASWARIALEAIPDPAVDDALRESLGKLQGKLLVGAINSIGVRRDEKATEILIPRLKNADLEVASAAAAALGRIGTSEAAKALEQSLAAAHPAVRTEIAAGCILCAEKYLANGKKDDAVKLYEYVRKAEVPKQRILEATRGSILARQSAGIPLLLEQFSSADKSFFKLGLQVAREIPGSDATKAMEAALKQLTPERQSLLILALSDRTDPGVLPALVKAAENSSEPVRLAAIAALGRLNSSIAAPTLLNAALDSNEKIAQAAKEAIANTSDKVIDGELGERLAKAEGNSRLVLIELAGKRRIAAAKPALIKAAEDPDAKIRLAALAALGEVAEVGDLPILIARMSNREQPEEAKVSYNALSAACARMPDRDGCAEKIVAALPSLPVSAKQSLLKILAVTGGTKALQAVAAAAKDADPEIRDSGSQMLGQWTTADAAPVLLDLAKSSGDEKIRIRAMRGYLRIVRQFTLPEEQRIEMCRAALVAATRDEEKKMTLEVLGRYPSVGMLRIAVEAGKTPSLRSDAARSAMLIAQKIGGESDEVRKLLSEMGLEAAKVEIVKAEYGSETNSKDVTHVLKQRVGDYPLIVLRSSTYNMSFGGDPAPGKSKSLKIKYTINGRPGEVSLPENAPILLPAPQ